MDKLNDLIEEHETCIEAIESITDDSIRLLYVSLVEDLLKIQKEENK